MVFLIAELLVAVFAPIAYLYYRSASVVRQNRAFLAVIVLLIGLGLESLAYKLVSELLNLHSVGMESIRNSLRLTLFGSALIVVGAGEILLSWLRRILSRNPASH
jgi:hypothetical protein